MPNILPDEIANSLQKLKAAGDQWIACCPAHEDSKPSLTLKMTDDGKLLVHCHANCDQDSVLRAIGYESPSTNGHTPRAEWTPHGDAVAVYDYPDESGTILFQVLRTADKQFPARRPDRTAKTGWRWSLGDTRRVPFRLPELIQGRNDGHDVCIAEGEKDVMALVAAGQVATCNPGGAGKWRDEFNAWLIDARVKIFADKDTAGQKHARAVAASLDGIASEVWILEAADPYKDIAAHLAAGLTLKQVVVTSKPDNNPQPDLAPDILDLLAEPDPDYAWLVEGLLERGDRLIVTGVEGLGKSYWLRQLAVSFAAGIHPTKYHSIPPLKVLMIDCENSKRQTRRAYRKIVDKAQQFGRPVIPGMLRVIIRPEGIDLPRDDDGQWLLERVTAHKPDVLMIGPLYRLHLGNPNDEETARRIVAAVDAARTKVDCAVIIEAHAGHSEGSHGQRSVRPLGSSLYLRWPEFGYGLLPLSDSGDYVELKPWRGARDERAWPQYLVKGTGDEWPWEERDKGTVDSLLKDEELVRSASEPLSERKRR